MKKLNNIVYMGILVLLLVGCSNKVDINTGTSSLKPNVTMQNQIIEKSNSEAIKVEELVRKDSVKRNENAVSVSVKVDLLLKQGEHGDKVINFQKKLYNIGYDLSVDGIFGNQTSEIVKKIQIHNNIEPTGNVDTKTDSIVKSIKDIRSYAPPKKEEQTVQTQNNTNINDALKGLTSIPDIKTNPGEAEQVIVVLAGSYGSIRATCTTYEKNNGNWKMIDEGKAVTGIKGFSDNRKEGDLTSPTGKYGIPFLFGNADNPGVKLPYRSVQVGDYWVSNKIISEYNVWMHYDGSNPKERLYDYEELWTKPLYKYAAVIDFNYGQNKIMGKGSGIFLHIAPYGGGGTLGCIGISETQLVKVIKWLDPAKKPVIIMGVKGSI
jgi:L,D-peptidoglycan transpeptidase YkuD (ErfK/YbiS/YcfS/YnhG family)